MNHLPFEDWLETRYTSLGHYFGPDDSTFAEYTIQAWEDPKRWLVGRFTVEQIGYVMWSEKHLYLDMSLCRELRNRAWVALHFLFRDLFTPLVSDSLGHLSESTTETDQINGACYMWWDVSPYGPESEDVEPVDTDHFLRICAECLSSTRPAIQESAIHGLGHAVGWGKPFRPARDLLKDFLDRKLATRQELIPYAKRAMTGQIL